MFAYNFRRTKESKLRTTMVICPHETINSLKSTKNSPDIIHENKY